MHDERVAGRELGDQVLATPVQPLHELTGEARGELVRQRPPQVRPPGDDLDELRALHHRLQRPAHLLDFRKFRHPALYRAILSHAGPVVRQMNKTGRKERGVKSRL